MMFLIPAIITNIFLYKWLKKKERADIFFIFLLYNLVLLPNSMNIMRQGIAIAIFAYSLEDLIDERYKNYFFKIVLASLFHNTAVILLILPVLFFLYKKNRTAMFIGLITVLGLILSFGNNIFNMLIESNIFSRYTMYEINDSFNVYNIIKSLLINTPIYMILLFYRKRINKLESNNYKYYILLILEIFFICTKGISFYSMRLAYYFFISKFVLCAKSYKMINNKGEKISFSIFIVVWALVYFIWSFYILEQSNIMPYNSIFNI